MLGVMRGASSMLITSVTALLALPACNLDFARRELAERDVTLGDTTTADDTSDTGVDTVAPCSAGLERCDDGTCADLMSDDAHCGACGAACEPGEVCSGGTCTATTPGCGWLDNFGWRRRLVLSTELPLEAGYSVSVELEDPVALVSQGKVRLDGADLRVAYCGADNQLEVLDLVLDPALVEQGRGLIWFATQRALPAGAHDQNYWLYYGDPEQATPPPNDWSRVFVTGADLRGASVPPDSLGAALTGTSQLQLAPDGLHVVTADPTSDGALAYIDMALPDDGRFAIRHHARLLSAQLGDEDTPYAGLEALLVSAGAPPQPAAVGATPRAAQVRLYVDPEPRYTLRYTSADGETFSWSGNGWEAGLGHHHLLASPDAAHVYELYSTGESWQLAVARSDGTELVRTSAVPWSLPSDVRTSLWFAWGDAYIDSYAGEMVSGWYWVRRYQNPEPSVDSGTEEAAP